MKVQDAANEVRKTYKLEATSIIVVVISLSLLIFFHFCSRLTISELVQSATLIILVLVTLWYAKSTYKLQTATNDYRVTTQQIFEVTRNAEINASAPVISLKVAIVDSKIRIEYENLGRGPALNFRVWLRVAGETFRYLESDKEKNARYRTAVAAGQSGSHSWIGLENRPLPSWSPGFDVLAEYRDIFRQDFESRLAVVAEDDQSFHYGKSPLPYGNAQDHHDEGID